MFISPAYAQAFGGSQDSLTTFVLPMALIFVVFYFFMIRPQSQKQKQMKAMLEALRRGDKVVTAGGVIGSIAKVDADEVLLEVADGVRIRVVRSTISSVLAKPDPAAAKKAKDAKEEPEKKELEAANAGAAGAYGSVVGKLKTLLWR
jgi:preprotein translocase subunit YajC